MMGVVIVVGNYFAASIVNTLILVLLGAMVYIGLLLISKDPIITNVLDGIKSKIKF